MTIGKQQTMWLEHENRSGLGHRKTLTDKVRKVGRGLWCLEDHVIVCPKVDSQAVLWCGTKVVKW